MRKETYKLLEEAYDLLFEAADKVVKELNPCKHKTVNKEHSCVGYIPESDDVWRNHPSCCCRGCRHWDYGCKAEKPLACRTWLCTMVSHPEAELRLRQIAVLAQELDLYHTRGDRASSLRHALWCNYVTKPKILKVLKQLK